MRPLNYLMTIQALSFALLWGASSVHAHPHNWIELKSSFVLDKKERLVQVKQSWEFDAYYSMMTLADLRTEHGSDEIGLPKTARKMIKNLAGSNYFSNLSSDGNHIPLGMPNKYRLIKNNKDGQIFLELEMTFDIKAEVAVENKTLTWQVFDPTYYVAMIHTDENQIEIIGGSGVECSKKLEIPEPSEELVEYAQNLDRDQKDTDGLGASFAERAIIKCY